MYTLTKNSKQTLLPKVIIIVVAALLLVGGGVYWWYQQQPKQNNTAPNYPTGSTAPTKEQIADNNKTGQSTNTVPPSDVPVSTTLAVTITKLEQANGSVVIQATVTGANAGSCTANFTTPEDRPIIKEVKATSDGANAVCGPITINEAEFTYLGNWNAKMTFYTADQSHQASSATKVINIK